MPSDDTLTYRAAGVDIDAGDALVERIAEHVKRTRRPEVVGGIGGFGGLFAVPQGYVNPVLVSSTDGVGTKLKLAAQHDAHDEVGIDLVAMCVNDVIVQGAEPLFFLDYYATPRLDVDVASRVIAGIARGCEIAGAALIGGETAEHPGMHPGTEYDLAGFCVGIVERDRIIDGTRVRQGDKVIGVASSGLHSNGFSLVRRILQKHPGAEHEDLDGRPLIARLMCPTRIYVRPLLALLERVEVKAMAHITGGGLIENLPRVLPEGLGARLREADWERPVIFRWLQDVGVPRHEMLRTFNHGIGMTIVVAADQVATALECLREQGERAWTIGDVVPDAEQRVEVS